MGQVKSKSFSPSLSVNTKRRLSDSDCLHLLARTEYFDNNLIESSNSLRRTESIAYLFNDTGQSHQRCDSRTEIIESRECENLSINDSIAILKPKSIVDGVHNQKTLIKHSNVQKNLQRIKTKPIQMHCDDQSNRPLTARIRPISMLNFDKRQNSFQQNLGESDVNVLKPITNSNLNLSDWLDSNIQTELHQSSHQTDEMIHLDPNLNTLTNTISDDLDNEILNDCMRIKDFSTVAADSNVKTRSIRMGDEFKRKSFHNSIPIRCTGFDCRCEKCTQKKFKILNWLLPNCSRVDSERLLSGKPDGTFLVRLGIECLHLLTISILKHYPSLFA